MGVLVGIPREQKEGETQRNQGSASPGQALATVRHRDHTGIGAQAPAPYDVSRR
jgi:hypothetical protein